MGYVDKNLAPGETVLHRARYHWVRFLPGGAAAFLGLAVVSASFFVPTGTAGGGGNELLFWGGLIVFVAGWGGIGWRTLVDSFDEYVITSFRVVCKRGVIKRTVRQIPLDKVQDLNIDATLWGRWLAYGDVEVQTAGVDGTVVFPRIFHPEEFRDVLFAHLQGRPGAAASGPSPRPVADRLADLEKLRKDGLVTEDEYRVKREALLKEL